MVRKGTWNGELRILLLVLLSLFAVLQVTFFRESVWQIATLTLQLCYLFVLPSYCLMLYRRGEVTFLSRLLNGTMLNLAMLIVLSYMFGVIGIPIRYHATWLPFMIAILGLVGYRYRDAIDAHFAR